MSISKIFSRIYPTQKKPSHLRLGVVADQLTRTCLELECETINITPFNYRLAFKIFKPDMLLVESAWQGIRNTWKYKIASYPGHPERNNQKLDDIVSLAKERGIPTVFWNKEDGVHFDRFIASAKLFDHIFTVDENCMDRYRQCVAPGTTVNTLTFPVQPATHSFSGFQFKHHRANFVGSYSHHVHDKRRAWQDMFFGAASRSGLGLTVIDRNSDRKSGNYRYPELPNIKVLPAVPHEKTSRIYKDNLVSLNVNTVEDSASMYSRRLVEILACGGIAVTNPSPAVERYFKDFCHVVHDAQEVDELFARLRHGPSPDDLARAEAGSRYVLSEHTWAHRLDEIARVVCLR